MMPYLNDEEIETEACNLLKILGVYDSIPLDGMTLIYKAKKSGVIQDYEHTNDQDLEGDLARYDPIKRTITLSDSTFAGVNRRSPREMFTIAHELSHAWFDHKAQRARASSSDYLKNRHGSIRKDEAEANRLAAAVLAPLHLAGNPLEQSADDIATRFGISLQVAKIRKPILERLYRRSRNIQRPLPIEITKFLLEGRNKGHPVKSLPNFEDTKCVICGKNTTVRNGTYLECVTCGATSGCS